MAAAGYVAIATAVIDVLIKHDKIHADRKAAKLADLLVIITSQPKVVLSDHYAQEIAVCGVQPKPITYVFMFVTQGAHPSQCVLDSMTNDIFGTRRPIHTTLNCSLADARAFVSSLAAATGGISKHTDVDGGHHSFITLKPLQ